MYLERTGFGIYRRVRPIPNDLNLSKLINFIYPKGKNYNERKKLIERYWKLYDIKENLK